MTSHHLFYTYIIAYFFKKSNIYIKNSKKNITYQEGFVVQ